MKINLSQAFSGQTRFVPSEFLVLHRDASVDARHRGRLFRFDSADIPWRARGMTDP